MIRVNSVFQFLSSHVRALRPAHIRPGEFPEFTAEEDATLMQAVAHVGRKWSRLPVLFPVLADRGTYELKPRHRCLDERNRTLVLGALLTEFCPDRCRG